MSGKYDPDKTRQAILWAAFCEVHEKGFRSTSLNDILARTQVTKGALYYHFPNKQALGYALVDEFLKMILDQVWLSPLEGRDDPITCLQEVLTTTKMDERSVSLGCPLNNLAVEMAPVDEGFRARLSRLYQSWIDGVAQALSRGQAAGNVRPDVDTGSAAAFIVASMAGSRSLAKNARSVEMLVTCHENLSRYLEMLRT